MTATCVDSVALTTHDPRYPLDDTVHEVTVYHDNRSTSLYFTETDDGYELVTTDENPIAEGIVVSAAKHILRTVGGDTVTDRDGTPIVAFEVHREDWTAFYGDDESASRDEIEQWVEKITTQHGYDEDGRGWHWSDFAFDVDRDEALYVVSNVAKKCQAEPPHGWEWVNGNLPKNCYVRRKAEYVENEQ